MIISIISVFPEIHEKFIELSLVGKAVEKGLIKFNLVRFSDFCQPKVRIDEPTCGPGAGMIIKPVIVAQAIEDCQQKFGPGFKVFFSPQGTVLSQPVLQSIAATLQTPKTNPAHPEPAEGATQHLILVCPRYEGMDERVQAHYADAVISIGDYVLMGGDLPAQVFLEGLLRLFPGIIGDWSSVEHESFSGPFLDHPEYGLPVEWNGQAIPEIVRSGNHGAIEQWRKQAAAQKTMLNRFDWFRTANPTPADIKAARQHIPPHYVALMHTDVQLKDGTVGTTSVVSIDLHDTARSGATYGIKNFFMVSPLEDQQKIMQTFLDFWCSEEGREYNESRYQAVSRVKLVHQLQDVIDTITAQEGKAPLLVTTSAKQHTHPVVIDFHSQGTVWQHNRPVLFIFGTGSGLADYIIERSDYLLIPLNGMTDYNHLSVRSATALIFDRWLGLNPKIEKSGKFGSPKGQYC